MMEIEKPKIICEEVEGGAFARFSIEPLEKGLGLTLGNAMRRTLLSSLPGAAPIGIRIAGVLHEFSTVSGVLEDVVDIVLNLKNLCVKTTNQDPTFTSILRLRASKAGAVTAAQFDGNDEVEILNPTLHICTLAEGGSFDLEVLVGRGRGYVPNNQNKTLMPSSDFIAIDSIFAPVRKVNYSVEKVRFGHKIDFDKLVLEVETNGTVSAREVVALSGNVVLRHLSLFIELCEQFGSLDVFKPVGNNSAGKILEKPIEELDFSVRSYNCLKRANINTVEDLTRMTKEQLLKVRNLGAKSVEEVIEKLDEYSLKLSEEEE